MKDKYKINDNFIKYRFFFDKSPNPVLLLLEDEITDCNNAALELFGYEEKDDIIGTTVIELSPKKQWNGKPSYELANKYFKEVIGKESMKFEWIHTKKNGEDFWSEVVLVSMIIDEKNYIAVFLKDISDIKGRDKLLKETKELEELRTQFFANLSHEIRTPLNVILGSIQLLELCLRDNVFEECRKRVCKHIKTLKQNCYRVLRVINNLLDITKVESGYFEIQLSNNDIVKIIEDITLSVVDYARQKNINLIFDTNVEEKWIACDPDKIEKIILNLLSNSIKFTNPGGNIFINIENKVDNIDIIVEDTGIGIPKDKIPKVFDYYSQVNKSLVKKEEGSGIGLSLAKSLIELHKGSISVNSEYGKGSKFIVSLPLAYIENEKKEVLKEKEYVNVERLEIEFSDIYSCI